MSDECAFCGSDAVLEVGDGTRNVSVCLDHQGDAMRFGPLLSSFDALAHACHDAALSDVGNRVVELRDVMAATLSEMRRR